MLAWPVPAYSSSPMSPPRRGRWLSRQSWSPSCCCPVRCGARSGRCWRMCVPCTKSRRAAALWGGSLAFASLHAAVVMATTQALDLPLPPARVALAYLAASSAAVLLPTPGGLGSLDAALAFALTLAGAPGGAAASVVLGYRLLTVWLPLVPGLVTLGVLVRRAVL
nr:lysylphosphatidylglycerol synthase domain-containing protein [Streptomyces spinoverrucosus]